MVLREGIQDDFSLHQVLSLFAIQLADLILDTSPQPTLDLVSLFESVLEIPHTILRQQVAHLKTQLMDEMKAAGVEYDERMERLAEVDHPKPLADFLYQHYNDFRRSHPWIAEHNVRPKSVAREMYEEFYSFNDYIRLYGLEKSEGQLLRYLSEFYKALQQTLPTNKRDEDLEECIAYFSWGFGPGRLKPGSRMGATAHAHNGERRERRSPRANLLRPAYGRPQKVRSAGTNRCTHIFA